MCAWEMKAQNNDVCVWEKLSRWEWVAEKPGEL